MFVPFEFFASEVPENGWDLVIPPSRLDASFELVSKCRLHTKYRALSFIIITRSAQLGSLSSRSLLSPLAINPSRIVVLRAVKIPSARFLSLKIQTRRSRKDSHPGSSSNQLSNHAQKRIFLKNRRNALLCSYFSLRFLPTIIRNSSEVFASIARAFPGLPSFLSPT